MATLSETIAQTVDDLIRREFAPDLPRLEAAPDAAWERLRATGTQLWLDTGDIDEASKLWTAEFSALTTNNTLLNKEVQKGIYDGLIAKAAAAIRAAAPGVDEQTLILEVAFVLNAWHGLRLVDRFGARVSVEMHTDLAHDVEKSVYYGKRYHAVCPGSFTIKVPLTPAGYLAARRLAAAGLVINFTLGFSARQNYLAALLTQPAYVNVFMGRLNAFVIDNTLGDGENVGEKATLATQRELVVLRQSKRSNTALIGASMRDGRQVPSLAGLDVFTMPPKVAAQYHEAPAPELAPQVENDPEVRFAAGVALGDFHGDTLWDVPKRFKHCVDDLLKKDLDALTPESLQAHFELGGFPGFLPAWTAQETEVVAADGKIPVFAHWTDRLRTGALGLDALMNVSGLYSFIQDQNALDARIKSFL